MAGGARRAPDQPLVALVPVSVRARSSGTFGNRIGTDERAAVHQQPDPVARLRLTHEALRAAKERHKALPAQLLQDATQFIPPAVFARASRVTFSLAATRSPGVEPRRLQRARAAVPALLRGRAGAGELPVSVITDGMGLNITAMSYCGQLDFGIVADREQIPDVWALIGWLRESVDELRPTASRK